MNVTVTFTTQIKAALGRSQQTVQLDADATVGDAIRLLGQQHPGEFDQLVATDGVLLPSILLCVNDQQVDVSAPLQQGDTLTLLSAISGG